MKLMMTLALLTLTACSSATKHAEPDAASPVNYEAMVTAETKTTTQYDGFYQTFQATVTRLTPDLTTAAVTRRSEMQMWDAARIQKERDRSFQEMAANTKFFVRLYTPEHQLNDMHQPNSIWKVYLDFEGRRLEAKVKKATEKLVELKTLYPYVDRFSNYYEVTFSLPTATVSAGQSKFILTGPVGSVEFSYSAH